MTKTFLIIIALVGAMIITAFISRPTPKDVIIADPPPRSTAIVALVKLGTKKSIPQIKELLKDKEEWVREEAESALKRLGVTDEEIQKAKEKTSRINIDSATKLIREHIFQQSPDMNPSDQFPIIELTTPEIFQEMGFQVFQVTSGFREGVLYIIDKNKVFDLSDGFTCFGLLSMCVSDLDENGQPELIYTFSWGSGVNRSQIGMYYNNGFSLIQSITPIEYLTYETYLFVRKNNNQKIIVEIGKYPKEFGKWKPVAELGTVKIENKDGVLNCVIEENPNLPEEFKKNIYRPQEAKEVNRSPESNDKNSVAPKPAQKESDKIPEINTYKMESLDWYKIEPIAFLDFLKKNKAGWVTIWKTPPSDWIKEKDVDKLIQLIDSHELCSSVVSSISSSYLPFGKSSTEGQEAMFLIEGFREGRYPPSSCSEGFKMNPAKMKKWWNERKTISGILMNLLCSISPKMFVLVIALVFTFVVIGVRLHVANKSSSFKE